MRKVSLLTAAFVVLFSGFALAQDAGAEMADTLRSNGKIYVVVLVLATIFAGIIALLVRIERKVKRLEQQQHS